MLSNALLVYLHVYIFCMFINIDVQLELLESSRHQLSIYLYSYQSEMKYIDIYTTTQTYTVSMMCFASFISLI